MTSVKLNYTDPALDNTTVECHSPFYGFPSQINNDFPSHYRYLVSVNLTHLVLATSVVKCLHRVSQKRWIEKWYFLAPLVLACGNLRQVISRGSRTQNKRRTISDCRSICTILAAWFYIKSVPELSARSIKSARFGHEGVCIWQSLTGNRFRIIPKGWRSVNSGMSVCLNAGFCRQKSINKSCSPLAMHWSLHCACLPMSWSVPFHLAHSGDQHVPATGSGAWKRLGLTKPKSFPPILRKVAHSIGTPGSNLL